MVPDATKRGGRVDRGGAPSRPGACELFVFLEFELFETCSHDGRRGQPRENAPGMMPSTNRKFLKETMLKTGSHLGPYEIISPIGAVLDWTEELRRLDPVSH